MDEHFDPELDFDWGGDGSDLDRPVRKHVEAALVPTTGTFHPPVDQLLSLGDPQSIAEMAPRVAELGLAQEHVPELVRMTRDRELNLAPMDSDEVWAPIHALHALAHLDVTNVIDDLLPLFDIDSEWFGEDLPDVLVNAGAAALAPLEQYLHDRARWVYGRTHAGRALRLIAQRYPELRDRVVQILTTALERPNENDPGVNGFVIYELTELKAVEALPAIRRAFELDVVDEMIMGDWESVQEELGQEPDPADPLIARSRAHAIASQAVMRASLRQRLPPDLATPVSRYAPAPQKKNEHAKVKNKRKMAKASRKANKSKKKKR
jgi:hypothetical protein